MKPGEVVAVLSETQSRQVLVDLAELALLGLGAKVFHLRLVSPVASALPIRSTGTTLSVAGREPLGGLDVERLVLEDTRIRSNTANEPDRSI